MSRFGDTGAVSKNAAIGAVGEGVLQTDFRNARCASVLILAALLAACTTSGPKPETVSAPEAVAAERYEASPGLSAQQRFREVLEQLETGAVQQARAELIAYLEAQPRSEVGADLLRQIDLPASDYYPAGFREITLASGQSLSTLAGHYLGSVYQFYALAKYNGITEPRNLRAGQTVRIPLTAHARDMFALQDSPSEVVGEAVDSDMPRPTAAETEVGEAVMELEPIVTSGARPLDATAPEPAVDPDALHREALNAYRAQDLDRAIALWDQVLEVDPNHESARLYRTQAIELQNRLRRLN